MKTADEPIATRTTGPVDLTIMLAMHDAFRRDLAHLARAADRHHADLEDPARRTALLTGWELFKAQLHHHHTAEDTRLWPRMRTHLADRPDDLAKPGELPRCRRNRWSAWCKALLLRAGSQMGCSLPGSSIREAIPAACSPAA